MTRLKKKNEKIIVRCFEVVFSLKITFFEIELIGFKEDGNLVEKWQILKSERPDLSTFYVGDTAKDQYFAVIKKMEKKLSIGSLILVTGGEGSLSSRQPLLNSCLSIGVQ